MDLYDASAFGAQLLTCARLDPLLCARGSERASCASGGSLPHRGALLLRRRLGRQGVAAPWDWVDGKRVGGDPGWSLATELSAPSWLFVRFCSFPPGLKVVEDRVNRDFKLFFWQIQWETSGRAGWSK